MKDLEKMLENSKKYSNNNERIDIVSSNKGKSSHYSKRYKNEHNEMIDFYNTITHEQGEPTYLSDGVWLYPDGSIEDERG